MPTDEMESKLEKFLGLKKTMVVESKATSRNTNAEYDINLDLVTYATALMPSLLEDSKLIGLGWGRTIYNIAVQLPVARENSKKLLLPLVGNSGTTNPFLQTSSIVNIFAERFATSAFYPNSSFIYFKDTEQESLISESLEQLNEYWKNLDAAVVSVGPKPENESFNISEVKALEFPCEELLSQNIAGEMIGRLYNGNGQINWADFIPRGY